MMMQRSARLGQGIRAGDGPGDGPGDETRDGIRASAKASLAVIGLAMSLVLGGTAVAQAPDALLTLQQENALLREELAAARAELETLRARASEPVPAPAESAVPDWVAQMETAFQQREQAIAERHAAQQAELDARLAALRARLPAPEGGTLTATAARTQAQRDAADLSRLLEQARGVNNPDLWRQVREAENALHHSQFLLARADNARTVYRLRPGETLATVSALFYGDPKEWERVFDANRHVLDDPARALPGMTLVVP